MQRSPHLAKLMPRPASVTSILLLGLLFGCEPDPPLPDYTPNADWVAVGAAPDTIREVPEHPGTRAPVNHIVVLLTEGETRERAEELAADLGGSLIGWMDDMRAYQLQVPTETMSELRSAIETLRASPSVSSAGYDFVAKFEACPAASDLSQLESPGSCAWDAMGFDYALTIHEELELPSSPVTVAVIDSGIAVGNGAFDQVRLADLNRPGGDSSGLADSSAVHHGTAVAGVIGADDGDGGVNGIASRFLGSDLTLASGHPDDQPTIDRLAFVMATLARRAIAAGARVLNFSFSFGVFAPMLTDRQEAVRAHFSELFEDHPDVLFVSAAGNETELLDGVNQAPGGIDAPNALTVASTMPCDPRTYAPLSNFGFVDIAAQGERLPVVARAGGLTTKSGTSFAAPQVAGAAAVLASIQPELSGAELRDYLVGFGSEGPFGHPSLDLGASMLQLVLDAGLVPPDTLDLNGDGGADPASEVVARVCGWSEYQVSGEGAFSYGRLADEEEGVVITATLGSAPPSVDGRPVPGDVAGFLYLSLVRPGSDTLLLQCDGCGLGGANISMDGPASVAFTTGLEPDSLSPDPVRGVVGEGISGEVQITACTILERAAGAASTPRTVLLSIRMQGQMEVGTTEEWRRAETRTPGFSASLIEIPTSVVVADPGDPLIESLEATCVD